MIIKKFRSKFSKIDIIKKIVIFLIMIISILQYRFWIGEDGVYRTYYLKKKIIIQNLKNEDLKKLNEQLFHEIIFLKKDMSIIESRARNDLGMVKQGEVFYRVIH